MPKKHLVKDIVRSIKKSLGRFLSIFLLMTLGSLALIALKVTGPDMEASANSFLNRHQVMDMTVIASAGLSDYDKEELDSLPSAKIDYGYMIDASIKTTKQSIRLFSKPNTISKYQLVEGRSPKNNNEILLSNNLSEHYEIGSPLAISTKQKGILKKKIFTIVGFVNSSEIWSKNNLGSSGSGDGNLAAYGYVTNQVFDIPLNTARLTFKELSRLNGFSDTYDQILSKKRTALEKQLADNGKLRYQSLKEKGQKEIYQKTKELSDKEADLKQAEAGLPFLTEPEKSAKQSQIESAKQKILTGQKEIETAREDLKNVDIPTYSIYSRETLPGAEGYQMYNNSTSSIAMVGNIFPLVFYFVAALVTFTTMTRFVDEERGNIGLLLALGYSKSAVMFKFMVYGFLAGFLGTTLGILLGTYTLSEQIAKIITSDLTIGDTALRFYWNYSLIAYALAILSALLPVYVIVSRELKEEPAGLLIAKPPTKGAAILLERIPFLWDRFSFTQKVTFRNIFRYKQRMLMTIFGVAGSVALLFAGLGIQSSLSKVVNHQFNDLMPYDLFVIEKKTPSTNSQKELKDFLESHLVSKTKKIKYERAQLKIKGQNNPLDTNIIVSSSETLSPFIKLNSVKDNNRKKVTISNNGVILNDKLARFYGAKKGSKIQINDSQNHDLKVVVADIIDMNVGHYIIMSESYYKQSSGDFNLKEAIYINLKDDDSKKIKEVAQELTGFEAVQGILQNRVIIQSVNAIVDSLKNVMTILVIITILLGLVIIYNLTTINMSERIRELSTIKVLGFYNKEVTLYIYRETILLSLLGIGTGIVVGKYLHLLIINMIAARDMNFGNHVDPYVYWIPIVSMIVLIAVLGIIVFLKLSKLEMLDALKSVN